MGLLSRVKTWIEETLYFQDINAEFDNILDNLTPTYVDDASATSTAHQTTLDPASLPTTLAGELQNLRYVIKQITGETYWYTDPTLIYSIMSRSKFVWGDATSLLIDPGAYWCKDKYCSWAAQLDLTVGTLTSGKWYDVYLDYSTITSGTAITNSNLRYVLEDTEVATWNDTYRGWYSDTTTDDRCIFGFYADGTNTMDEFFHDGDLVHYSAEIEDHASAIVTSTWKDVALTIPKFAHKAQIGFYTGYAADTTEALWKTNGATGNGHQAGGTVSAASTTTYNTLCVHTDASQTIEIRSSDATGGYIVVNTSGWYFPAGM